LNNNTAKKVLDTMYTTGTDPEAIVKEKGLAQESDEGKLLKAISGKLDEFENEVARYLSGEEKVMGFLMGQIMRSMNNQAPAQVVKKLLAEELERRRG